MTTRTHNRATWTKAERAAEQEYKKDCLARWIMSAADDYDHVDRIIVRFEKGRSALGKDLRERCRALYREAVRGQDHEKNQAENASQGYHRKPKI